MAAAQVVSLLPDSRVASVTYTLMYRMALTAGVDDLSITPRSAVIYFGPETPRDAGL